MQMQSGLHGKLEELGLDEILQIVGVSRRTGMLTLQSRGREAVLQFRDGLLVRVSSTGLQQPLGELLVRKGAVTAEVVQQALIIQQQVQGQRIGVILRHHFKVDLLVIEQAVREQIRNLLMTLFAWTDGTFDCAPCDIESVDAAYLDPVQLLLELEADSPEQLVTLGVQAEQALGAFTGQSPDPEPVEQHRSELPPAVLPELVLVDDDTALLAAVGEAFKSLCTVTTLARTEDALVQIDSRWRNGVRPLVVVDLIMPKMDGSGVLGGLELLRLLHKNFAGLRLTAMSDFQHAEACAELATMNCPYLDKPRRGEVRGDRFEQFLHRLKAVLAI